MTERDCGVHMQLELDFSAQPMAIDLPVVSQQQAKVICFQQSKQALELRTKVVSQGLSDDMIRSRIDNLLSRYK
jgi:hypothetical protein